MVLFTHRICRSGLRVKYMGQIYALSLSTMLRGCCNQNHDGMTNKKETNLKRDFGVTTIIYSGKILKTINIR